MSIRDFIYDVWVVSLRERQKTNHLKRLVMSYLWIGFMFAVIASIGGGFDQIINFDQYGGSYTQFFLSGFIVYVIAMTGLHTGANMILDKDGFQKLFLVVPISKMALILGTELMLIMFMTFLMAVLIIISILFGTFNITNILLIYLFSIFVLTLFLSIGIWLSTVFDSVKTSEMVMGWMSFLLMILSGMMFPISSLPKIVRAVFMLNPVTYIVDIFRYLMTGYVEFPLMSSLTVLAIFSIVSIFLGTYMYDKNLRA